MLTTVTNTTFLFLSVALITCLVRYLKQSERGAGALVNKLVQLSGSRLTLAILALGCGLGLASHLLLGSMGTGDLFQDFVGAKEFLAGRSMNPPNMPERVRYWLDQEGQARLSHWPRLRALQIASIEHTKYLTVQGHTPFHILLVAPMAALFRSAMGFFFATCAVSLIAYAGLLWLLWRIADLPDVVPKAAVGLLILLALDWQPLLANVRDGQIHTWVACLIAAGWYFASRGRSSLAGISIGLAALLKMFPALLLFWLLIRRRRAFFAALATICVAVGFLYIIRGPGAFIDYWNTARSYEDLFGRSRQNYSLSSVIPYIIAGPTAKSVGASAAVALADLILFGFTASLTLRHRTPSRRDEAIEFGSYVVLACLLSPTVEAFYFPLLLIPLAMLAGTIRAPHGLRNSTFLLAILWCLSPPEQAFYRPMQTVAPLIGDRAAFLLFSIPTFAMLALWCWTVVRQRAAVPQGLQMSAASD